MTALQARAIIWISWTLPRATQLAEAPVLVSFEILRGRAET